MKCSMCETITYNRNGVCCDCKEEQRKAYDILYARNNERLSSIPLFTPSNYIVDFDFNRLEAQFKSYADDYGGFEYNPDFQRGHVWTQQQQIKYIESFISNILSDQQRTITLNCPDFDDRGKPVETDLKGMCIIDGLQRVTASIAFLNNEFKVFGKYSYDDLLDSKYSLKRRNFKIQIYSYRTKAELLNHYLLFNSGGVVHSESELDRVRKMLQDLSENN